MIDIKYNSEGIRVDLGEISRYNKNLPFTLNIRKHISNEITWSTNLNDFWYATFPNSEMNDVEILDSRGNIILNKKWNLFECGNSFYKSLWMYNKKLISDGIFPKGLVIGTHDGEFGEWVPVVENRDANVVLVEATDEQFNKLKQNYKNYSLVKPIKNLVTPKGGDIEFFYGGEGYTNTVVEKVIRHWEKEEVKSEIKSSISITDLILNECGGKIDWLHLDVEGLDSKLIMGIDENKISLPNFIIFEDFNLSDGEKNEIYEYLKIRNFELKSEGGICEAIRNIF